MRSVFVEVAVKNLERAIERKVRLQVAYDLRLAAESSFACLPKKLSVWQHFYRKAVARHLREVARDVVAAIPTRGKQR